MQAQLTRQRRAQYSFVLFLVLIVSGCGRSVVGSTAVAKGANLTNEQVQSLNSKKIFFGHQSVGENIIQGLRDLIAEDPRLTLDFVHSADPQTVQAPALVEFQIGQNGNPQSKNDAFSAILDKGLGAQGGVALFKYCYVDIDSSTDVQAMFESYRELIASVKAKYPRLKIVHVTVPLTTVEPEFKSWVKSQLGRSTLRDQDAKRNAFNALLKQTYSSSEPIFDLAEVESTHLDGSRAYFTSGNEKIYTLAPEFTTDGGHLNRVGQRAAAERFLLVLAKS